MAADVDSDGVDKTSLADADAASWAREESVGSDAIVASSCGGACRGDWDWDLRRVGWDVAPREGDDDQSVVWPEGGKRTYRASALQFCAANFEIWQAWHTRVFFQFYVDVGC